ncbi:hypothetical protein GM418_11035 [Maribellus comscasis]|uniref:Uncharacterized protein n=1 Tax=Maribellus comscasis TaxID=2681766 RepID=A0A6I6K2M8_9BACT|nr:hypothetical protein [Maribellus comscasis]QGY44174.1 hypothetical protein GM418_11035 [Maribellus comscasis]
MDLIFTGDNKQEYNTKEINIDKYIVSVIVDDDNRFIGISKIEINKAFISHKTKLGVHQVEEFYQD